jgi:hypothetical protein
MKSAKLLSVLRNWRTPNQTKNAVVAMLTNRPGSYKSLALKLPRMQPLPKASQSSGMNS